MSKTIKNATHFKPGLIALAITASQTPLAMATAPSEQVQSLLEEVVVTAQKREQSLQEVGVAVSAFNADELKELGVSSASEITEAMPNVQLNAAGGSGNQIVTIRGIGLNDYSLNNTPTAAMHIDEVYLSSNAMTSFALFDLERAEVLKGPQGTLFGRNSTAGVVNFITRKPTQEFDAYVEATLGNFETTNLEAAVGGGLTENVAARASMRIERSGEGFQKNRVTGNDHGEVDKWAARLQLAVEASEDVSLLFNIHGGQDKSDAWFPQFEGTDDGSGGTCASARTGDPNPNECFLSGFGFLSGAYSDTDGDPHKGDYDFEPEADDTAYGGFVRVEVDMGSYDITSITGYEYYDYDHGEETDALPLIPGLGNVLDRIDTYTAEQLSQEVRLSSFDNDDINWVVGLFATVESGEADQLYRSDFLTDGVFIVDRNIPFVYDQDGYAISLFGQAEWNLAEDWKLTLGGRYAEEKKEWDGHFVDFGLLPSKVEDDWENYSWKVGLDHFVNNDVMVYGSISRGFKAGGIPGAPPTSGLAPTPYDSEIVLAYELGFKTTFPEQNLQLNGAAFFYDYEDMQGIVKNNPADLAEQLDNFGDVEVSGAELDLLWHPTEGALIKVGAGWLDSEITKAEGTFLNAFGEAVGIKGNETPHAPGFSANVLARYEFPVAEQLQLSVQADLQHKTDYYLGLTNDAAFAQNDDVNVWGARIALTSETGDWSLALWGKNLSDEEYRQYGNYSLDNKDHLLFYNLPRSYGLTLNYNFQ